MKLTSLDDNIKILKNWIVTDGYILDYVVQIVYTLNMKKKMKKQINYTKQSGLTNIVGKYSFNRKNKNAAREHNDIYKKA